MSTIAIILAPDFADWEYALLAGTGKPFYGLDIRYFTPQAGELQSQGGLSVRVSEDMKSLESWQPDILVVIGSTIWIGDKAPDISTALANAYARGAVVAGICGGTLALARAGLLDRSAHTSNDGNFLIQNAPHYQGAAYYRTSPVAVTDNRIISAPGTAPVSFTAAIFEAAGLAPELIHQFRAMLAAEHA